MIMIIIIIIIISFTHAISPLGLLVALKVGPHTLTF